METMYALKLSIRDLEQFRYYSILLLVILSVFHNDFDKNTRKESTFCILKKSGTENDNLQTDCLSPSKVLCSNSQINTTDKCNIFHFQTKITKSFKTTRGKACKNLYQKRGTADLINISNSTCPIYEYGGLNF